MSLKDTTKIDGGTVEYQNAVSGRLVIELTDEEMEYVRELAEARNESYASGRTRNTVYGNNSSVGIHRRGITAEYALTLLYDEAEMDEGIYEQGDDGIDLMLNLDGEKRTVDVKASKYRNAHLMLKKGRYHGQADAYVSCYVDGNCVEILGWVSKDELCVEDNVHKSKYGHLNYEIQEESKYVRMPIPNLNDERTTVI